MGIFSFFTKDSEDDEDDLTLEESEETGRQSESAAIGELFMGMRLDVTNKD